LSVFFRREEPAPPVVVSKPPTPTPVPPGTIEEIVVLEEREVRGVSFEPARDLEMIHFEFDESRITEEARSKLEENAEIIKQNPGAVVQIQGHCDERGTNEYNIALGQRRVRATRDYLIKLGVDAGCLVTISYGEESPLDPRHNEEAWAKNRRAQFGTAQQ
ncbi:MAG: peptidoglycan-associated lipoprotein Pal, partial [Candidatus Hydrogenedentes bacterium]|nr:peptidoglycan-associated lipoprotein Pal [Candidatus Hydrogenedentota bacterium]